MKSNVMKTTGLVLAMAGALSMANAQEAGEKSERRKPPTLSAEEMISKFDKDGDGKLSAEELESLVTEMKSRRPGGGEGMGNRGGGMTREEMLEKYDTDGDGKLSEAERAKMMEEMRSKRRQLSE